MIMKSPFSRFFNLGEKDDSPLEDKLLDNNEISDDDTKQGREEVRNLPISQIVPNRFQPRTVFDDEKINELLSLEKELLRLSRLK